MSRRDEDNTAFISLSRGAGTPTAGPGSAGSQGQSPGRGQDGGGGSSLGLTLALVAMLVVGGGLMLVTLGAVAWIALAQRPGEQVVVTEAPAEDTGLPEPEAAKPTPTTRSSRQSSEPTATAPAVPDGPGRVSVSMSNRGAISSAQLSCPDGSSARSGFVGDTATFEGIAGGACTLVLLGGPPAQFKPVRKGTNLSCQMVGTVLHCS